MEQSYDTIVTKINQFTELKRDVKVDTIDNMKQFLDDYPDFRQQELEIQAMVDKFNQDFGISFYNFQAQKMKDILDGF